jgi:hypothetical protein
MNERKVVKFFLRFFEILVVITAATFTTAVAQDATTQTAPVTTPSAQVTTSLHGHISDQTGAMIPGAKVTLTDAKGRTLGSGVSDAAGAFEFAGLRAGNYIVLAVMDGFAPFASKPLAVTAGQNKRVDVTMAIATEQQSVIVTDESPSVNVEASGNSNAIIIKGSDLDALSDDPDELASELNALAGPAAGPNGGQIYIDGFTGGQLPPKSAIREIRINQNPFSAEFDKIGYGRIEILTKPGTDKLHGSFFVMGNHSSFNTGNPFDKNVQPYYRVQFNGNMNGALNKYTSFAISVEDRDNHDVQVYDYSPLTVQPTWNGSYYYATQDTNPANKLSGDLANPHNRFNIAPRLDIQLGTRNTVTLRYQFYHDTESGDIGSTQLPAQSTSSTSNEHTIQASDSIILNDHVVNEIRFQYVHDSNTQTAVSTAPTVQYNGNYTDGGASSQSENDREDHFELQDITTWSAGNHAIKFGTRLRENRESNNSDSNFNGTFTFTPIDNLGNLKLTQLTYSIGPKVFKANVFDAALFFQDDWKYNKFLTLSGGLRWESQNQVNDHSDWAPRFAFAYALDGHKNNQTKTVLRAGYGIFYDRLQLGNIFQATRLSGGANSVQQYQIANPTCFDADSLSTALSQGCGATSLANSTKVQIYPSYHSPYMQQLGTSLERQLGKAGTATVTYLHTFGVHQMITRDCNQPGGAACDASFGHVNEYYTQAVFKQDQVSASLNAKLSKNLTLRGFYNYTVANSDGAGGTASNANNLSQDYGRAGFASRHFVMVMGNYTGPWKIAFNPFMIAVSGKPFNIVTGGDEEQNGFFNTRPTWASDPQSCSAAGDVSTTYGCFNTDVTPGSYTPIPVNLGRGPASVAFNLRVSRVWGLGPKVDNTNNNNQAGGTPGGGRGPGGGPGGGMGGMGGFGGGGRGGPPGPATTNHKYNLNFSVQALNLFNNINYGTPLGTLNSPGFGRSTNLAGMMFSQGPASRRVFAQLNFSF